MADFRQKKAGERLSAERDWNPIAQRLTELGVEQRQLGASDYGNLYGQAVGVVPKYSLLEVYDTTVTGNTNEQPVVGIRAPTSGSPVGMVTNGHFPTVAGKPSKIDLVLIGQPLKFDIDTGDTGFTVGEECGPESGSYQLSSSGTGFVCLSAPITYESTRKFVWASARGGGGAPANKYFILKEDVAGIDVWAKECDRDGTGETGDYVQVGNWGGLIDGAKAGYFAQFAQIDGNWDITLGDCPGGCESDGVIDPDSPPTGTVGVAYTHTVVNSDLNSATLAATGLPGGLSMDTAGDITGTPTTAGTYYVQLTGTSPATGEGVTGDCTITVIMVLTIEAAP